MNIQTLAARHQVATDRIRDAAAILATEADMHDEVEALEHQTPTNEPRVKALFTLEALAAILEKVARIKGGQASIEPTYRITQQEHLELQGYREQVELVGERGPEQLIPADSTPAFAGRVLDDGVLYQLGQDNGPEYTVGVALVANVGGVGQPIILGDMHPERVRLAAANLRELMGDQAALSHAQGEPGQDAPPAAVGAPGDAIDPELDPDMAVFNAKQREALAASGLLTPDDVRGASDEQLLAVNGIADGTLAKFRELRPAPNQEPPTNPPAPNPPNAEGTS